MSHPFAKVRHGFIVLMRPTRVVCLALLTACGPDPAGSPTLQAVTDVKQLMSAVLEPAVQEPVHLESGNGGGIDLSEGTEALLAVGSAKAEPVDPRRIARKGRIVDDGGSGRPAGSSAAGPIAGDGIPW